MGNRGFTLIEILIATVILSFMMMGVITFTDSSSRTVERVTKEDREFLRIELALSVMDQDFTQIYSPLYYAKLAKTGLSFDESGMVAGKVRNAFQGFRRFPRATEQQIPVPEYQNPDKTTLEVFTFSNFRRVQNEKQSVYSWIRYEIKSSGKESQLFDLVRKSAGFDPYNPELDFSTIKEQIVLSNIKEFEFQFWNPRSQKFVSSLGEIENGRHIIHAIKIIMKVVDSNQIESYIEKTFRPIWPGKLEDQETTQSMEGGAFGPPPAEQ